MAENLFNKIVSEYDATGNSHFYLYLSQYLIYLKNIPDANNYDYEDLRENFIKKKMYEINIDVLKKFLEKYTPEKISELKYKLEYNLWPKRNMVIVMNHELLTNIIGKGGIRLISRDDANRLVYGEELYDCQTAKSFLKSRLREFHEESFITKYLLEFRDPIIDADMKERINYLIAN